MSDETLALLLLWTAVALLLVEFFLLPPRTARLFPSLTSALAPGIAFRSIANAPPQLVSAAPWWGAAAPFILWATGTVVLWIAIPWVLLARQHPRPFSLLLPATWSAWRPYLLLAGVMLPLVLVASTQPGFLRTYPMLRPEQAGGWSWTLLGLFWIAYALTLVSTEFIFRGVLLFALESRLGLNAVLVTVLPYSLIHVHKPPLEALGSIVAGSVLGVLALRTRSIGGGILLHVAVALTMDFIALAKTGRLPSTIWP